MSERKVNDLNNLNPTDAFLIRAVSGGASIDEIQRVAGAFLRRIQQEKDQGRVDFDTAGLTGYTLQTFYSNSLTPEQRDSVNGLVQDATDKSQLMRDLTIRMQALDSEARTYFKLGVYPYNHSIPTPVGSKMVRILLDLKCISLQSELEHEFRDNPGSDSFVIERFFDEQTGMPGIWMSTQGIHFDPRKIRKP